MITFLNMEFGSALNFNIKTWNSAVSRHPSP